MKIEKKESRACVRGCGGGDIIRDDRVSPSESRDRERCRESVLWRFPLGLMHNFIVIEEFGINLGNSCGGFFRCHLFDLPVMILLEL